MRFVSKWALYMSLLVAVGCSRGDNKTEIKEPTAEEIQMQKESQQRVNAEESQKRKSEPPSHQQSVKNQEAGRQQKR